MRSRCRAAAPSELREKKSTRPWLTLQPPCLKMSKSALVLCYSYSPNEQTTQGPPINMGIAENWQSFVNMTQAKAESHGKYAQFWDTVHTALALTLIFLSTITTLSTLLPITHYVPAALGAATTLISAINGSMQPGTKRQAQTESRCSGTLKMYLNRRPRGHFQCGILKNWKHLTLVYIYSQRYVLSVLTHKLHFSLSFSISMYLLL